MINFSLVATPESTISIDQLWEAALPSVLNGLAECGYVGHEVDVQAFHGPGLTKRLAVLQRREQIRTLEVVEKQSRLRGNTPEEQLLAIFDVFHDWFQQRDDFEGCSFINVLLELGAAHPAGQASIHYLDNIRTIVRERAQAAGLRDPDQFARSWHILMTGSIISAAEGDLEAAHRAQTMARNLIAQHRPLYADGVLRAA